MYSLREIGFGAADTGAEAAQNAFARLQRSGASGTGLRSILSAMTASLEAATKHQDVTQDEKKNAWDLLYDVKRPQLQTGDRVPDWLLNEIKGRVYKHLLAVNRVTGQTPVMTQLIDAAAFIARDVTTNFPQNVSTSVQWVKDKAKEALPPAGDKPLICSTPLGTFKWDCWSTETKVVVAALGVGTLGLLTWIIVRSVQTALPVAAKVAERRFGGVPSRGRRGRRRK